MLIVNDFFKRKKCEHDYEFVRNIYGDEINWCLPVRCIQQRSGGQRFVWVADGGKAKACNVTTAQTVGNRIVIADGLKGGEQVIVEGWQKVGEGTAVKVSQSGK